VFERYNIAVEGDPATPVVKLDGAPCTERNQGDRTVVNVEFAQ
jgi:hypothetical protein